MQSMTVFDLHLSMIDITEIENHDTTDSRSRVDEKDTDVFHDHSSLLNRRTIRQRMWYLEQNSVPLCCTRVDKA